MMLGIFRACNSPACAQTFFIPFLITDLRHVLRQFPGVPIAIESIPGTAPEYKGQHDLPPDVATRIYTQFLASGVRQIVKPVVQLREAMASDRDQLPSDAFILRRWTRLAARRAATWPRISARLLRVILRISFFNRRYSLVHSLIS